MKFIYKGKKRPFIYVTNYGDVFLNDGDVIEVKQNGQDKDQFLVYKNDVFNYESYHRHVGYLSNFIPHKIHGFVFDGSKKLDIFKAILEGKELTQLEYEKQCIKTISENLPKEDISISHYQFSNQVRPINRYTYKDGLYYGSNYEKGGTALQLAWYIYRNLFKVFPYDTDKVTAEDWEQQKHLY